MHENYDLKQCLLKAGIFLSLSVCGISLQELAETSKKLAQDTGSGKEDSKDKEG